MKKWLARVVFGLGFGSIPVIFVGAVLGLSTLMWLGVAGFGAFVTLVVLAVFTPLRTISTIDEVFGQERGS